MEARTHLKANQWSTNDKCCHRKIILKNEESGLWVGLALETKCSVVQKILWGSQGWRGREDDGGREGAGNGERERKDISQVLG